MGLTWSTSRDQILHTCERRYYFQYVINARVNSRDDTLREIAFLKKLKTLPMWQGDVFHTVVANSIQRLKQGKTLLPANWLAQLTNQLEQEWTFSLNKQFRSNSKAIDQKGGLALFEHEYDEGLESISLESVLEAIATWIQRFAAWAELVDLKNAIQTAKRIWIEPQIFGTNAPGFTFNNVQVITKVDLALLSQTEQFEIFDWKTGLIPQLQNKQLSKPEFQVGVYQLWAHLGLKLPLDRIQAHLVYFGADPVEQQTFSMDQNSREYILSLIRRSIDRTLRFSKHNEITLSLEDFDFATYPQACCRCSFKRLCQRVLEPEPCPTQEDNLQQLSILSLV